MRIKNLGVAVDLTAQAAQTAVTNDETPWIPGQPCAVFSATTGLNGATMKVQGSDDNSTWTDLVTVNAQGDPAWHEVTLQKYMRLNVTGAGAAGTGSATLLMGA